MACARKELHVACSYLLRLMKPQVALSNEQINLFKHSFHDVLSKRFIDHWFPATPHRGSAYRCLQTKNWRDPVLKSIAERSRLPLQRYLPAIFTIWIDPGEVAVCFGDEGTWCPLYKHDIDGQVHQEYSDGEETVSSLSSDDDLLSLTQDVNKLNVNETHIPSKPSTNSNTSRSPSSSIASNSRASSPFFNSISPDTNTKMQSIDDFHYSGSNFYSCQFLSNDWNEQQNALWSQQLTASDSLLLCKHGENF